MAHDLPSVEYVEYSDFDSDDFLDDFLNLDITSLHEHHAVASEGAPHNQTYPTELEDHPLFPVLLHLLVEVRRSVRGEPSTFELQPALSALLLLPDVQECVYVERGVLRFSCNEKIDEFFYAALCLYDELLQTVRVEGLNGVADVALRQGLADAVDRKAKRPLDEREAEPDKSKVRRLPKEADAVLKKWLLDHVGHPFPDDDEKDRMVLQTGLTRKQISNYFINARRRFLVKTEAGYKPSTSNAK